MMFLFPKNASSRAVVPLPISPGLQVRGGDGAWRALVVFTAFQHLLAGTKER